MIDMMNVIEVRTNLEAVANRVDRSSKEAALRLRDLSRAVGGGPNADAWAACDVTQLIAPDQIIQQFKNQPITDSVINWMEWFRNILIFAPLVVTWYGISQAANKYAALIKASPDQVTQPFLYLWQTGFGNRLGRWQTLSFLASIDFILLGAILVMTFVVYSLSNLRTASRDQEAEKLRGTLSHALAGANLCLRTRSWHQPTNFVDRFDQIIGRFDSSIGGLLNRVSALTDRQDKELQVFSQFKTELDTIMKGVSLAITDVKTSTSTLSTNVKSLQTPLGEISVRTGELSQRSQNGVTLLNQQNVTLGNLIQRQEQWMQALNQTLQKLDQIVGAGVNLANHEADVARQQAAVLTTISTQQKSFLDVVQEQQRVQGQLTANVNAVLLSVKDISAEFQKISTNIHGYNTRLEDLYRRVAGAARP